MEENFDKNNIINYNFEIEQTEILQKKKQKRNTIFISSIGLIILIGIFAYLIYVLFIVPPIKKSNQSTACLYDQ